MDQEMMDALSLMFKQQEKRIEAVIDEKLQQQENKLDEKFESLRKEVMHDVRILLDTEVTTKFNLLAEGQEEILRRMPSPEDAEIVNGRLEVLEAMVKRLSRDIEKLKKAN